MRRAFLALIALTLVVGACSGSNSSPTAPPVVIPNYTGIWSGTYTVSATGCTQTGTIALADVCGTFSGRTFPYVLNIAQNGVTNAVNGTFTLGQVPFTMVQSTVTSSGVTFTGTSINDTLTIQVTWNLTSPIVGSLTQIWSSSGLTGQATVTGVLASAVKTGSVDRQPAATPQSIPEFMRALTAQ